MRTSPKELLATLALPLLAAPAAASGFNQLTTLESPAPAFNGTFGRTARMSAGQMLIGAPGESTATSSGSVYVFEDGGSGWSSVQALAVSDPTTGDFLGNTLAVDGDVMVLGTSFKNSQTGAAYVFERSAGVWTETAKLTASDAHSAGYFGSAVAVSGSRLAVAARSTPPAIYVFEKTSGTWAETAKLAPAGPVPGGFGQNIALDGGTLVVTAWLDGTLGVNRGSAFVFFGAGSQWTQQAQLLPSQAVDHMLFGRSIDVDGDTVVVSSYSDALSSTGTTYVFERTGTAWAETARLLPAGVASSTSASFGADLHLGATKLVVGTSGLNSVIVLDRGTWSELGRMAPQSGSGQFIGGEVFASDDTYLFGDPFYQNPTTDQGGVHVWKGALFDVVCDGTPATAACPCGNNSPGGSGEGCTNSTGLGGLLSATGSINVANDDFVVRASQLPIERNALVFAGPAGGPALPFGDGLMCTRLMIRYPIQKTDFSGGLARSQVVTLGNITAGSTLRFQVAYRDPIGSPCGSTFNLTNSIEATFCP